ncbi:hypothetical protein GCM10020256_12140 [Streptomyces thermocoprophilus]
MTGPLHDTTESHDLMPRAQLHAYVSPSSPEQEDTFNKWIDESHIPQVVERIPGIIGGFRYRLSEVQLVSAADLPARRYLPIYELDTHDLPTLAHRLAQALGGTARSTSPTPST